MELDQSIADGRSAGRADRQLDDAERQRTLEETNGALEQKVVQHRMAAELARGQSEMLIQSLHFLAAASSSFSSLAAFSAEASLSNFMAGQRLPLK